MRRKEKRRTYEAEQKDRDITLDQISQQRAQPLPSVTAEVSVEETALQTGGLGSPSCARDAAGDTTQNF